MSSDSSDEENLEFLREAQDSQFINDFMFSDSPAKSVEKTTDEKIKQSLPSLRKIEDEDEQFNLFRVTPEFRSYVAKQLTALLDKKLEKQLVIVEAYEKPRKNRKKGGVKLFSDSEAYLKVPKVTKENDSKLTEATNLENRKRKNKHDVEVSEDLLKEVAVTPEDILSKKEVKYWSKRSKAPVFNYKKVKTGQLELVEPEFK